MAMKNPNTDAYDKAVTPFKKSVGDFVDEVVTKIKGLSLKVKSFSGSSVALENNTIHVYEGEGIKKLDITYPDKNFISTVIFSTASSGNITVTFPDGETTFVGSAPLEFLPAEDWELNIYNGQVVGAQIYR